MAKILTRGSSTSLEDVRSRLQEIITENINQSPLLAAICGTSHNSTATLEETVEYVNSLLEAISTENRLLFNDLAIITSENLRLNFKLNEYLELISEFLTVSYDEALDHAVADLMDAFCSSGSADVTTDGKLEFTEKTILSKSDLKPILREAISRWVGLKV